MPKAHDPWEFFIGDTWDIYITCGDSEGQVLDVTNAEEMEWVLDDANGVVNYHVLKMTDGFIQKIYPLTGRVRVTLPASLSKMLAPKDYSDMFTLYMPDGNVSTQTFGIITARAKPSKSSPIYVPTQRLVFTTTPPLVT